MWGGPESYMAHLALAIARAAAWQKPDDPTALRLALRVLAQCGVSASALAAFWECAAFPRDTNYMHRGPMYDRLVELAREAGYDVAGEYAPCNGWTMCNHYRMTASRAALMERYGVQPGYVSFDDLPAPDLFPRRKAAVVQRNRTSGFRGLETPDWGFPRKMKGASGKVITSHVTNVRNLDSPFWRSTLEDRQYRCLVAVTSFSEYGPGPKGARPLFWFDVPSRPIFSFAGIWRTTPAGSVFAFLTTEPNEIVRPIHPKAMPVILHDDDEERWLTAPIGDALDLVAAYPSQLMSVKQAEKPGEQGGGQPADDGRLDI
ncbi:hypothetical protein DMC47_23550 [Nostoc sp. 3335mG]|nr:hypothetical protein DMC47_23550 [Nostoc sp. 3335mG]